MTEFDAILFDCDGVLLDSEPLASEALARAISAAGLPFTGSEAMRDFSGGSARSSLSRLDEMGLDAPAVFDHADRILFAMFDSHVPQIQGVENVLWDYDVPMAVCSNSLVDRLDRSLGRTPLARRFGRHIYSAQHVSAAKPAPDLAFLAAAQLGVPPSRAIFIDDNPHGILCGRAAGCMTVGFIGPSEHRENHAEILRNAGADHVVHGMTEFHQLLAQLSVTRAALCE